MIEKLKKQSSPHLKEIRERVKINGKSLSQDKFRQYLIECFDKLEIKNVNYLKYNHEIKNWC